MPPKDKEYYDYLRMLKYYWDNREDLEAYSEFHKYKKELKKRNPEVWLAWKKFKKYKSLMESVINNC